MTVNRIKILQKDRDKKITIPISNDFDESLGREQLVSLYERSEMQDNINIIQDFETTRYRPITDDPNNRIYYQMGFQITPNNIPTGSFADYVPDYAAVGITHLDINRRNSNYTKSFFKFDFYDTPNPQQQRLYFSIVNPAYYKKLEGSLFEFTAVGKRTENYFIQWLKDRDLVKYNVFYMTCKFFNAETGKVHKFINKIQPANTYDLSAPDYFYYQLIFDPIDFTYVFNEFDTTLYAGNNGIGPQVGDGPGGQAISFYEYINP